MSRHGPRCASDYGSRTQKTLSRCRVRINILEKSVGNPTCYRPELTRQDLIEELLELLRDEEEQVKRPTYMTILSLFESFCREDLKTQLIGPLRELIHSPSESLASLVAESFGILFYKLSICEELNGDELLPYVEAYAAMAKDEKDDIRRLCAFNLPAVLHACGTNQYGNHLDPIFQQLASDESKTVRNTVAFGMHQIVQLLGPQRSLRYLKDPMLALLDDEDMEVQGAAMRHCLVALACVAEISDVQQKSTALDAVLQSCVKYEKKLDTGQWRQRVELLKTVYHFVEWYTDSQLNQNIVPILLNVIQRGTRPEQLAAVDALVWYTRNCSHPGHRHMNITKLRTDLALAKDWSQRALFLDACHFLIKYNSTTYFSEIFLDAILPLFSVGEGLMDE